MAPPLTRQDFLKIGRFVTKVCSRCLSIRSHKNLVAPQGFEPRSSESESLVLPLNEGAPANDMLPESRTKAFADCLLECTGRACQGQRHRHQAHINSRSDTSRISNLGSILNFPSIGRSATYIAHRRVHQACLLSEPQRQTRPASSLPQENSAS